MALSEQRHRGGHEHHPDDGGVDQDRDGEAGGERPGGLTTLECALDLAEPEGYRRTFLAEGEPMQLLVRALAERRPDWAHLRELAQQPEPPAEPTLSASGNRALVDPLSERERDVLRLLATDLDGREIARELVVSLNTVRTHTKHTYTKLGVGNRRAAVSKAHRLDLLGREAARLPRRSPGRSPHGVTCAHHDRSYRAGARHEEEPAVSTNGQGGQDADWYEIRLAGCIDERWTVWFDGMALTTTGVSLLRGHVVDQAALHGVLARLRDLGLPLLSVVRIEPEGRHDCGPPDGGPAGRSGGWDQ